MKTRVLIAEDDAASRELLAELLETWGYTVEQAMDGQEALCLVRTNPPDVLLMDVQMPTLGGPAVAGQLRADSRFSSLPIIALTAFAMRGDRERLLDAGFNEYLTKPLNTALLRDVIARYANQMLGQRRK